MRNASPAFVRYRAERMVDALSPYAAGTEWSLTKQHHALWVEPVIEALQRLPEGSRVLEVGPGYGTLAVAAVLLGHQVTAVELFIAPLQCGGVEWLRGDICNPELLVGEEFDFCVMTEVLEHLTCAPRGAFVNIRRALRPGAKLWGSTPTPGIWPENLPETLSLPEWTPERTPEDRHVCLYSQVVVADLLREAGYRVLEQRPIGVPPYRHLWRAEVAA